MKTKEAKDDILTLSEVAEYLKLSEKTLLRMANRGDVPTVKIGNQWRFSRAYLEEWLDKQISQSQPNPDQDDILVETEYLPMSRFTDESRILISSTDVSRNDLLRTMCESASSAGLVREPEALLQQVLERERLVSTNLGNGVAIPHPRVPDSQNVTDSGIVVSLHPDGLAFDFGGKPVHLVMLVSAISEATHLRVLAFLGRMLRSREYLDRILAATTAIEIQQVFVEAETRINFTGGTE